MARILQFPSVSDSSERTPLVPVVPRRGRVPERVDEILSDLARSAESSTPSVRNALFTAYWPILQRTCQRAWWMYARRSFVQLHDVESEAFLVFAGLLDSWPGNGSFTRYLLARFIWRLREHIRRLNGAAVMTDTRMGLFESTEHCYGAEMALALLDDLVRELAPFDQQLVLRKVRDGDSLARIASDLGVTRRTAERRWKTLRLTLYRDLRKLLGQDD